MSFVIDEEKVKELIAASAGSGYTVSISPLEPTLANYAPLYSATEVSGTDSANFSTVSIETRKQLVAIRKRIVESGEPLHNVDALTREIEGMRGRNR
jgi:hypothetical protein